MSKVLVTESYLQNIAAAIRSKAKTTNTYTPAQMAAAINNIPEGYPEPSGNTQINYNGTYNVKNRATDVVNVANTYTQGDEGKVVNSGNLTAQGSLNVVANGTYDTKLKNTVVVDVPNTYSAGDEGKVVNNGTLVTQTDKNIVSNGTHNTKLNKQVIVNVPNSYTENDQGKVVQGNSLVSQTSRSINADGTYDTTKNNQVVVNVGGGADLDEKTITANGVYDPADDNCDGYDLVTVNVPNTYAAGDEGKVVDNGALVAQTSTTKNANGTYDTTLNNEVVIAVPNTYTQSDEGKVVSQGALVAQSSATKTANGTYDTTLNNSIVVAIPVANGEEF